MKIYTVIVRIDVNDMALNVNAESKLTAVKKAKSFNIGKVTAVYEAIQNLNFDTRMTVPLSQIDEKIARAEEDVAAAQKAAHIESSIEAYQKYTEAVKKLENLKGIKGEIYA